MTGWHLSIYRQAGEHAAMPATAESPRGTRLAVWQAGDKGLRWLDGLVKAGEAISLGGDGYPCRYTATAGVLVPRVLAGPPEARQCWIYGEHDILSMEWAGKTMVDQATAAACRPDEWLLIEAWDES
jgi:hypothetical protein